MNASGKKRASLMTQTPFQTLLTGFGPFGTVACNPTERLVRYFAETEVAGHDLTTCVLPTSFTRAPEMFRAALADGGRDGRPFDYVLMLGVASGSKHWRVERMGRNRDEAPLPDIDDFTPPTRRIDPDAPEVLPVHFPVETLVTALEGTGLPVVASDSAGAYLCNHLLFAALNHLQNRNHPARAGFLHVPADEQTFASNRTTAPQFPFAQHIQAVQVVLSILAERRPARRGDYVDL